MAKSAVELNDMDELYDLNSDPEELVDLAAVKPSTVSDLRDLLIKNQIAAEQRSIGESIAEDAD